MRMGAGASTVAVVILTPPRASTTAEARPNWLSVTMASRLASLQTIFLSVNLLNQCLANPVLQCCWTALACTNART